MIDANKSFNILIVRHSVSNEKPFNFQKNVQINKKATSHHAEGIKDLNI